MDQPAVSTEAIVSRLFVLLHGYFGNQFFDKFRTGQSLPDGGDEGMVNAKKVWVRELAPYPPKVIGQALATLRDRGTKFPPSLPEFVELCRAARPPVPQERRIAQATPERASSEAARAQFDAAMTTLSTGRRDGISGLIATCAKAISLAGGDEVVALRRLERETGLRT